MFKRVTVEQVKEAYALTGLKPIDGVFYGTDWDDDLDFPSNINCACALGAIYCKETGEKDTTKLIEYLDKAYSTSYRLGFTNGFDGANKETEEVKHVWLYMRVEEDFNEESFLLGHEDGEAARKAVFGS